MQHIDFHVYKLGETSWGIKWTCEPSREFLQFLLAVKKRLEANFNAEIVHTYTEILLKNIKSDATSLDLEIRFREIIKETTSLESQEYKVHRVPVCYDSSLGEDIVYLAKAKGLTVPDVIKLHTAPLYTVYFMGFLPGFPYLLGLDERLYIDRKSVPKQKVVQGSVAIGGQQTGIYPQDSPGGWHTIGHSPILFFDVNKKSSSPFKAGDYITFYEISVQEHKLMQEKAIAGTLQLESTIYEG